MIARDISDEDPSGEIVEKILERDINGNGETRQKEQSKYRGRDDVYCNRVYKTEVMVEKEKKRYILQ